MRLKIWIKKNRYIIFGLVAVIALTGLFKLKTLRDYYNGRISYKGRTYLKSEPQVVDTNMKKEIDETVPTGKYIFGNEIYDIPNNPYHSTVIFLKTRYGSFEVYSLSGGP